MNNSLASDKKNTMCTESNYSYTATQGTDTTSSCIVEIAQESATGHVDMLSDGEQVLMPTMAQQLVSIVFETEQSSFKSYLSLRFEVAHMSFEPDRQPEGWVRGGVWNISTSMYTSCLQCTRVFTCLQTCHTHFIIFPTDPRWLKPCLKMCTPSVVAHTIRSQQCLYSQKKKREKKKEKKKKEKFKKCNSLSKLDTNGSRLTTMCVDYQNN